MGGCNERRMPAPLFFTPRLAAVPHHPPFPFSPAADGSSILVQTDKPSYFAGESELETGGADLHMLVSHSTFGAAEDSTITDPLPLRLSCHTLSPPVCSHDRQGGGPDQQPLRLR